MKSPWTHVRIGKLDTRSTKTTNPYGARECIPIEKLPTSLDKISLVIPCFTPCGGIPSGKAAQLSEEASYLKRLWTLCYIGVFDMDADLKRTNGKPLFIDEDVHTTTSEQRQAASSAMVSFSQCLREKGWDARTVSKKCPAFGEAATASQALENLFIQAGIPVLRYYSGGKGWRVLVQDPVFFFRVHWFGCCADTIAHYILPRILKNVLNADNTTINLILRYIDPCVWDREKGVKPDYAAAHPVSGGWPTIPRDGEPLFRKTRDDDLANKITQFWTWVVQQTSQNSDVAYHTPRIQADLDLSVKRRRGGKNGAGRVIPWIPSEWMGGDALEPCYHNNDYIQTQQNRHGTMETSITIPTHVIVKSNGSTYSTEFSLVHATALSIGLAEYSGKHFFYEYFPQDNNQQQHSTILAGWWPSGTCKDTLLQALCSIIPGINWTNVPCVLVKTHSTVTGILMYWPSLIVESVNELTELLDQIGGAVWRVGPYCRPALPCIGAVGWNLANDEPDWNRVLNNIQILNYGHGNTVIPILSKADVAWVIQACALHPDRYGAETASVFASDASDVVVTGLPIQTIEQRQYIYDPSLLSTINNEEDDEATTLAALIWNRMLLSGNNTSQAFCF